MQAERTEPAAARAAFRFRDTVRQADAPAVQNLVAETGFFNAAEIDLAEELVVERLSKGSASGYEFFIAEQASAFAGYVCYGAIAGTLASYDLYWIVVSPQFQKQGLGRALLSKAEQAIWRTGGRRVYVETSSRDQYAGTRAFYSSSGYKAQAVLEEFYAPGDHKMIFVKRLMTDHAQA
ncbi:hypothetical protein BH24PSE2_BH24PSE2_07890 [soil metagenome]